MGKEKHDDSGTRISLAHLSFEEAVTALVQPTQTGSQAGESCSTKSDDPEAVPSEK